MNDRVKVFWCEPTDRERRWLRRYRSSDHKCSKTGGYCNAMHLLGEFDIRYTSDGYIEAACLGETPPDSDPRWPACCAACGEAFGADDPHQLFGRQIYVRAGATEMFVWEDAPPGACRDAWWISERRKDGPTGCGFIIGDDHRSLEVVCPDGHHWMIDNRARNCTMPNENTHHCWVRHGRPEDGTLHVDKNGHTCAAGAGSIDTGTWHGFLHHGELHT